MENVITIKNLTKDYGDNRGVFNINLEIKEGEMVGFVGTNGSGKTTTIRNILGFLKPDKGEVIVNNLNSWKNSSEIVKDIGYVPGEIAFPDLKTGSDFLKSQAEFLHLTDMSYAEYLIKKLQLDPRAPLKRMSKGMKQKTAIVAALMADPKIIILDEPTTGLDPLMRDAFLEIIKEEHNKGKTIFMSSHMFEELEKTCDRVALIRDGHIVDVANVNRIHNSSFKQLKIEFLTKEDYQKFKALSFKVIKEQEEFNQVTIKVKKDDLNLLFNKLKNYKVKYISEVKYTLERHFKEILKKEGK